MQSLQSLISFQFNNWSKKSLDQANGADSTVCNVFTTYYQQISTPFMVIIPLEEVQPPKMLPLFKFAPGWPRSAPLCPRVARKPQLLVQVLQNINLPELKTSCSGGGRHCTLRHNSWPRSDDVKLCSPKITVDYTASFQQRICSATGCSYRWDVHVKLCPPRLAGKPHHLGWDARAGPRPHQHGHWHHPQQGVCNNLDNDIKINFYGLQA